MAHYDYGCLIGRASDFDHDSVTLMTSQHFAALRPHQVESLIRCAAAGELVLIQHFGTNIPITDYLRRAAH